MKMLGYFVLSLLVALALPACHTAEKYAANNAATEQWLNTNAGTPSIDVSGRWHADGWGGGYFTQKDNRITGYLGNYPIGGVVKGRTIYLALTSDGWTYYTAIAKQVDSKTIEGFYSSSVPFSSVDESPFQLLRVNL